MRPVLAVVLALQSEDAGMQALLAEGASVLAVKPGEGGMKALLAEGAKVHALQAELASSWDTPDDDTPGAEADPAEVPAAPAAPDTDESEAPADAASFAETRAGASDPDDAEGEDPADPADPAPSDAAKDLARQAARAKKQQERFAELQTKVAAEQRDLQEDESKKHHSEIWDQLLHPHRAAPASLLETGSDPVLETGSPHFVAVEASRDDAKASAEEIDRILHKAQAQEARLTQVHAALEKAKTKNRDAMSKLPKSRTALEAARLRLLDPTHRKLDPNLRRTEGPDAGP